MKERLTFIHAADGTFDPKLLQLENDSLHVKSLKAAQEYRITVGLYELPQEIWIVLKQCHELHLRWASPQPYQPTVPFASTVPPGLHAFVTPLKGQSAYVSDKTSGTTVETLMFTFGSDGLFPLLHKLFGNRNRAVCTSLKESFVSPVLLSQRFASLAAYQYFENLPSLEDLETYIHQKVCAKDLKCTYEAERLRHASYFDFDYDTVTQSATLSAFWAETKIRDRKAYKKQPSDRVEVGILAKEKSTGPEKISLGGFLAVLGEDSKPNPTLFSFPSRHHLVNANFSAHFTQPTGLHPTLRLTFPHSSDPPHPRCALHAYMTIPSHLFVDQYQLSSLNYLASRNLHSIRSISGETDLEAPNWATSKWGSALLLELAPPSPIKDPVLADPWHTDIPLHLRYLRPPGVAQISPIRPQEYPSGHKTVSLPWPNVFWACPTDEGTKMNTNPFDRINLGYDGLFGPRTMFNHWQPASNGKPLVAELKAPVMDLTYRAYIESVSVATISLGFLWVVWKLLEVVGRNSGGGEKEKQEKKE